MPSPAKRAKKKVEKYEARELWEPSPSPVEDWGSADGVDFSMEIVGEEVRYDGERRFEVNWGGWKRPNGTSTTWEGPDTTSTHLPTTMWENQRTRTPAFELWGTSDIHNALTRERQQGHEETTKEELAAEQAECDKLMQRMHNSLAKHRIPFPAKKAHRTEARTSSTAVTVVPLPLPRRSQINAQASSSRIHVNAEAGPSRTRQSPCPPSPPRVHAMPPTTTASFSRLPPAAPSIPLFPPRVFLPRRPSPAPRLSRHTSPAISISSSSTESIEFLNSNPTLPTAVTTPSRSSMKRRATSPVPAAPPPPVRRRGPPIHRDLLTATIPSIPANAPATSRTSGSAIPLASCFRSSSSISGVASSGMSGLASFGPTSSPFRSPAAETRRRPLKRKADDDDGVPGRVCSCGTMLPPPDVYSAAVCSTCHQTNQKKKWWDANKEKGKNEDTQKGKNAVASNSSSSSTGPWRSETVHSHANPGKIRPAPGTRKPLPLPPPKDIGKGKAKAETTSKSLRVRIESAWSQIAKNRDDAEGISFVNDVDDEEVPPSLYGEGWEFEYLEDNYRLSGDLNIAVDTNPDSVTPLVADPSFFIPCDCPKTCKGKLCGCQDEVIEYAYTDGLFNFKYLPNQLVVECNPYCNCAEDCDNRVTQRARKFKIEVFKTERCGWGVRAAVDVEKGKVLGVYTGKLIPRAEAEQLTGAAKEYCFDLDYNEGEDTDRAYLYSVDSLECGNWTRFINHSCQPNLRVQPVVYDTLPSQNAAFLAFIATDFITAQTEFTFDYDPEAWGARRPCDAQDCMCRAERCRGWVRTE